MKYLFFYIVSIIILQSCDYFTIKNDTRQPVARVNNTYLYKEDLKNIITSNITSQDSILLVHNYINNWIKQQLLLSKAQINLENKTEKFENLVKKYREDLFINSYKEAVVKQYLDTEITSSDIDQFYLNNNQNFKLNEELIKLKYIKIGKDVLNKKELIKLFRSDKKEDLDSLNSKELFLKSYHLNDSIWVKYSDLIVKIPIFKTDGIKQLLKKGSFIQKEDSLSLYLVAIKQVLKRKEIAPKSYITPTIKQMILHQRKLLLLRNIEETLIDDANKKQQFEIY
jgi:hypothetical protein